MAAGDRWIDLLDPTPQELKSKLPREVHDRALDQLLAPAQHRDDPRPKLESHGDYVFGVFLIPVVVPEEDLVFYQEVDAVLTREVLVTVRKSPGEGRSPWQPKAAQDSCRESDNTGMMMLPPRRRHRRELSRPRRRAQRGDRRARGPRRGLGRGPDPDAAVSAASRRPSHPAHARADQGRNARGGRQQNRVRG